MSSWSRRNSSMILCGLDFSYAEICFDSLPSIFETVPSKAQEASLAAGVGPLTWLIEHRRRA